MPLYRIYLDRANTFIEVHSCCCFTGIKSLISELCKILENILQMTESVAAAFPYNRDHSTIVDLTKMAQKQLAIGKNKRCRSYDEKNSVQPDLMHIRFEYM